MHPLLHIVAVGTKMVRPAQGVSLVGPNDRLMRFRADADRRRVLVMVTNAGRGLLRDAPPLLQEGFVERLQALPEALWQVAAMMDPADWSALPLLGTDPAGDLLENPLLAAPVRTGSD